MRSNAFFDQGLEALKVILQAEAKNLQEQVDRQWIRIHNQHYDFDRRETLLSITERVTYTEFVDFYRTYLLGKMDSEGQTSVRELLVGAFSNAVATVTFDVPRQVAEEDQYMSVRELRKSAMYWDQ